MHLGGVKENIKKIFAVRGMPEALQLDNGKKLKGSVKQFHRMKKIRMVQSRPYNSRDRGKVEWSHRVMRNKILFDMVAQIRSDTNWVKDLPNYMKCLNNEKREELGWQSLFQVYFGRKSTEFVRCGFEIEAPQKIQKFPNQRKMISIDLKNYAGKQENEHLIPIKGLQREQLNILEKRINVLCNK